ncbi:MAG TPA: HlyD family secretion protein, partial [Stellaceae bacterium]|nr:HlyD family secretion protein [Stellaceae bacterium]
MAVAPSTAEVEPASAPARTARAINVAVRLAALAVAGIIVVLFATQWDRWVGNATRQATDDAYIRGDITPLSAKVEGYVRRVPVHDFDRVKAGDLLVEIEDSDYQAQAAQAEAALLGAHAAIENLKARKAAQHSAEEQAQDAIKATQADLDRTQAEAVRQRALLASTFGTRQRVEQAEADEKRYAATLARNQAEADAQHRQMAVLDTQEMQLRAEAKAKQAALDLARINLGYTRIVAPIGGMVSERGVREGQYVHAGSQVISVVPLEDVWVVANYRETQLTHV